MTCGAGASCTSDGRCVGEVGASCSSSVVCDTAAGLICVTDWSGASVCHAACTVCGASTCPAGEQCYDLGTINGVTYGACLPPDPLGAVCGGCAYGSCAAGTECVALQGGANYGYCLPICDPSAPNCPTNLTCTAMTSGSSACYPAQANSSTLCEDLCNALVSATNVHDACGLCGLASDVIASNCSNIVPVIGPWICNKLGDLVCQLLAQDTPPSDCTCAGACNALGLN